MPKIRTISVDMNMIMQKYNFVSKNNANHYDDIKKKEKLQK